jgi:protease I
MIIVVLLSGCVKDVVNIDKLEEFKTNISGGEKMGNVLFIIAQKNFRDEELSVPKNILEDASYRCDVASITTEPAKGMLGIIVKPDLAVKNVSAGNYELVVVIGGGGSPALMNYPEVLSVVRNAKKIAGICLGPMTLAKAGVLNGKKATVFETAESKRLFEQEGAIFLKQDVVVDGDIVTANGPEAAEEFGNELLKLLED